jgi:hypothetical protein
VVGIFPNEDTIVRLIGAISKKKMNGRSRYMTLETIAPLAMIQQSAFRLSPTDLPGSCRRTRCPTASYTTPGDTIPSRPLVCSDPTKCFSVESSRNRCAILSWSARIPDRQ